MKTSNRTVNILIDPETEYEIDIWEFEFPSPPSWDDPGDGGSITLEDKVRVFNTYTFEELEPTTIDEVAKLYGISQGLSKTDPKLLQRGKILLEDACFKKVLDQIEGEYDDVD